MTNPATPTPTDLPEALRLATARAIWAVMREHEDRCDMELEDMGEHCRAWALADAALNASASVAPPVIDFSLPLETYAGEPVKYVCHDVIEHKCARVCVDAMTGRVYSSPYIGLMIRNRAAPKAPQEGAPADDEDGAAFRKAARLGLTLRFYGNCAQSGMPGSPSAYEVMPGEDRVAAMREAVKRAAAVIESGGEAQRLEQSSQAGADSYPPMPLTKSQYGFDDTPAFTARQMRAFADATVALRARGAVPQAQRHAAAEVAVPLVVATAPRRIYLDLGFDPAEEDAPFSELHEITWSANNASGHGVEYVRADLAARAGAQAVPNDRVVGWQWVKDPEAPGMDYEKACRQWRPHQSWQWTSKDESRWWHLNGSPEGCNEDRTFRRNPAGNEYPAPAAVSAPSVPEGWKLVPVEPTDEMVNAAYCGGFGGGPTGDYLAMLAAAPQATAGEGGAA